MGHGRLLSRGFSDDEVAHMLHNDVVDAIQDARSLDYWHHLDDVRRLVVVDLCFNLGLPRWKRFIKANAALNKKDYEEAADEMVDSQWYRQTGRRAKKLVHAMRSGAWTP